jgi:hypothetical protein
MIFIYGNKVSMFSHQTELVGIIIKNQDFATTMRFIFETYFARGIPFEEYLKTHPAIKAQ